MEAGGRGVIGDGKEWRWEEGLAYQIDVGEVFPPSTIRIGSKEVFLGLGTLLHKR